MLTRTTREEELQIEVERLKSWLGFIANEAWKADRQSYEETSHEIERFARTAIAHGSCVTHPDWGHTEDWAKLGVWP